MTIIASLQDLSFEASEVLAEEVEADQAYDSATTDTTHLDGLVEAEKLLDVYAGIVSRNVISRDDMEQIHGLAEHYPSLKKLLSRYPVGSFSHEPSRINYEVSNESFIKSSYEAVVRALREILKFLVEGFRRLWKFMSQNAQRTAAVDDLRDKLNGIQQYVIDVDRIMSETSVSEEFAKMKRGAFENERHNVSKNWNEFRNFVIVDTDSAYEMLTVMSDVLKMSIPPFAEAVEEMLIALSNATTEHDIQTAIAKMSLHTTANANLVRLAHKYNYRPGAMRTAPNMTPFHATASYIRSVFRSWGNHRMDITPEVFANAVANLSVRAWGEKVNDAIKVSGQRTERLMTKIGEFNENSLKPGMEDAYAQELVPFFKALLSIIQGYTLLENCLGDLIATRDNAVIAVSKGSLNIAKAFDGFVKKHGDVITIGGKTLIGSRRRAILTAMS